MGHFFYLDELREVFSQVHAIAPCENYCVAFSEEVFFRCFGKFEGFLCRGLLPDCWTFVVFHHWDRYDYKCSGDVARFAERCYAGDATTSVRVGLVDGGVRFAVADGVEIVVDHLNAVMC